MHLILLDVPFTPFQDGKENLVIRVMCTSECAGRDLRTHPFVHTAENEPPLSCPDAAAALLFVWRVASTTLRRR